MSQRRGPTNIYFAVTARTSCGERAQQAVTEAFHLPTLVVIARDEARCIERCLRSAKPYTQRMLVLDTGSRDSTAELARACGAEVHFFQWVDDFSAARNRALELADSDWNLFLDADEWIQPGADFRWPPRTPMLGLVRMMSIDQSSGMDLAVASWMPRLMPRGVRYAGRIHEQPVSSLPRFKTGLVVDHDGYTKGQLRLKRGRNRGLLALALRETPHDPYLLYQYGCEHEGLEEFGEAVQLYQQALALMPKGVAYEHSLRVRTLHSLSRAGQVDRAIDLARQWEPGHLHSPDFHFVLGNLFLDKALADPAQALALWLPEAIRAWQCCLAIGDQPELEGSMQGRGSYLAAFNLQVVFDLLGEPSQALHYQTVGDRFLRAAGAGERDQQFAAA